jgi:hypothetical protein
MTAIEGLTGRTFHHFQLHSVKFTAPLRPGDPFTIILEPGSARQLSFAVTRGTTRIAWGTLEYTGHAKQDVL